ncbi:hypothetical protein Tco_0065134 [Tanacetum coccineum]
MKRGFSGEHTPLFPCMLVIQAEEGEGSGHPSEPQPPPSTAQPIHDETSPNDEEWDDKVERDTTTVASLDAAQASGNITKTQSTTIPNVPLSQEIGTCGSPSKVESLETDLKQTKQVYGVAYTKLIMKVKKLEKTVKTSQARRRAKIVVSDDEEDLEDSSKQGRMIEEINQDAGVTLVTPTHSQEDQPKDYELLYTVKEVNKIKWIARVHEEASSFTIEEWEDIQATIEADEELAQRIQAEEREKYSEAEKARLLAELINQRKRYFAQQRAKERRNKPLTQAQQRTYMSNYIKHMGSHTLQ